MQKSVMTVDSFSADARKMRGVFESRFRDPLNARADRFVWDYWHVPGQYTALRTPAYHFFPKTMYDRFHNHLVWWGRRNLGCHDVSPPWMSCYVDGCKQELHGDLPHGPWAFVFSLTPWSARRFTGGETVLIRDEVLDYWNPESSLRGRGLERAEIFREVPARFNRLTVFDPRIPHGVNEVRGVHDVLDGRLVIHGWFVQPRPFIEGPLGTKALQGLIDDLSGGLAGLFEAGLEVQGMTSLKFAVSRAGRTGRIEVLSSSLRSSERGSAATREVLKFTKRFLESARLPKQRAPSSVTLPLIFATL